TQNDAKSDDQNGANYDAKSDDYDANYDANMTQILRHDANMTQIMTQIASGEEPQSQEPPIFNSTMTQNDANNTLFLARAKNQSANLRHGESKKNKVENLRHFAFASCTDEVTYRKKRKELCEQAHVFYEQIKQQAKDGKQK